MCTHVSVISSLKGEEKNLFSLNLKAAKRVIRDDMHSAALHATSLIAHQPGCSENLPSRAPNLFDSNFSSEYPSSQEMWARNKEIRLTQPCLISTND